MRTIVITPANLVEWSSVAVPIESPVGVLTGTTWSVKIDGELWHLLPDGHAEPQVVCAMHVESGEVAMLDCRQFLASP